MKTPFPKLARRLLLILTIGSLVALVALNLDPVTTRFHRLVILCSIVGIWSGPLLLFWKHRTVRFCMLPLPLLVVIPFLLPAKTINRSELRADYLKRMVSYEGTPYHWGGENGLGIDCSGLPRKAIRDALFSYGIRHMNGTATRAFFDHWWNDASAKALAEGYRNFTIPTDTSGTIVKMDYGNLLPGDLVVTEDRRHILAFLGGEEWIQADPGARKVIILNGRTSMNGWFGVPVTAHRWSILMERGL